MRKSSVTVLGVSLLLAMCAVARAGVVLLVSDAQVPGVAGGNHEDDEFVAWLGSLGHFVDTSGMNGQMQEGASPWAAGNEAKLAALQNADLVIVSRRTGSGSYDGDRRNWNELGTPLILNSGYLTRGGDDNRWGWTTGGSNNAGNTVTDMVIEAGQGAHPFLAGLPSPVPLFDWSTAPTPGQAPKGVYLPNDDPVSGTLIGTFDGRPMLMEFAPGYDFDAGNTNGPYGIAGAQRAFLGHWGYDMDLGAPFNREANWDDFITEKYEDLLANIIGELIFERPVLTWDNAGDGEWAEMSGGFSRWRDPANPLVQITDTPDITTITTLDAPLNDTVNVGPVGGPGVTREAYSLEVVRGGISINQGSTLNVDTIVEFVPGSSLAMVAGAKLAAGGGGEIDSLSTAGDATISTGADMIVANFSDGGVGGTFVKQDSGTLMFETDGVTAGAGTTFRVEGGVLEASGADPLGAAGQIVLTQDTKASFKGAIETTEQADALCHRGYMVGGRSDALMDFHSGGKAFAYASGVLGMVPVGEYMMTGPLDFANDAEFRAAIPEITRNDDYQNAWTAEFTPSETATYQFTLEDVNQVGGDSTQNGPDDRGVLYIDVNEDGTFQLGERIAWDNGANHNPASSGTATLTQGRSYKIAMGHKEHGGGSDMAVSFETMDVGSGWEGTPVLIDPSDTGAGGTPTQAGLWNGISETIAPLDMKDTAVTVQGDSELEAITFGDAAFGPLTMENGVLTTSGAVGGVSFNRADPGDPADTTIPASGTPVLVGFNPQVTTDVGVIQGDDATEITITKQSTLELVLDEENLNLANTTFKVEDGTLRMVGLGAFGGATKMELAGGTFRIEGLDLAAGVAPDDAFAHWSFDDPVDPYQNQGTDPDHHDGTAVGDQIAVVPGGIVGKTLQINTTDPDNPTSYVDVGNFDSNVGGPGLGLNFHDENWTLSAWIKTDYTNDPVPGGDEQKETVFAKGDDSGGGIRYCVIVREQHDTRANIVIDDNAAAAPDPGNSSDYDKRQFTHGVDVVDGQWHFVVGQRDGDQLRMYIDGVLQSTGIEPDYNLDGIEEQGNGMIGAIRHHTNLAPYKFFRGQIDEVRLYNRVLSAEEVAEAFAGNLDLRAYSVDVTGSATLDVDYPKRVDFGPLSMTDGGILTTTGPPDGMTFTETSIDSAAETVGFDTNVTVNPGPITNNNVTTPLSIQKTGPADLILEGTNTGLDTATFDVQAGRLIGVPSSNPFNAATLIVNGGEIVLAARETDTSPVAYDNPVIVESSGIVTAGPGGVGGDVEMTINLGSTPDNGVTLNNGTVRLRSTDQYTLNVAGELSGSGGVEVSGGAVNLAAGGSARSARVSGESTMNLGADLSVETMRVTTGSTVDTGTSRVIVSERLELGDVAYSIKSGVPPPEGLLALYYCDEGAGARLRDRSEVGERLDLSVEDSRNVSWLEGGLSVDAATLISSAGAATKITDGVKDTGDITVEAWIKPASADQTGPARIVTLSPDTNNRNFTLGQENKTYDFRFRTTTHDPNGTPSVATSDVIADTPALQHVVYTRESATNTGTLYVDGQIRSMDTTIDGDVSVWDGSYKFGLANEMTKDRAWLGEVHHVGVYNRAMEFTEVMARAGDGPPVAPPLTTFAAAGNLLDSADLTVSGGILTVGSRGTAGPLDILFVVDNPDLSTGGDQGVYDRLTNVLGHTVTPQDDNGSDPSQAAGMDLVIISATVGSANVTTKFTDWDATFRAMEIPTINWEQALSDDFHWSDGGLTAGGQDTITILNDTHYLAAGLPAGDTLVFSAAGTMSFADMANNPAPGATVVAHQLGDPDHAAILAVDEGGELNNSVLASARRLHIFLENPGLNDANQACLDLFDAAVNYAVGADLAAEAIDQPNTDILVTASSEITSGSPGVTLGNLTVTNPPGPPPTTLTLSGTFYGFTDVTTDDGVTIVGDMSVAGNLSVGSSSGTLNFDGELELAEATYLCEVDSAGADLVDSEGLIILGDDATLELLVLEGLGDPGCYAERILQATGGIEDDFFMEKPAAGQYLDYGVFLDSYGVALNYYDVNLFQAEIGDTDGDGDVDLDDLSALDDGWDPAAADKIWKDGDFDFDGDVDLDDLSALDDNWNPGGYPVVNCPFAGGGAGAGAAAVPEPGTLALLAMGLAALLLWGRHRRRAV